MQFLILEKWVTGEADDQGVKVSDEGGRQAVRDGQEAVVPEGGRLPELPQAVGHDARRREVPGRASTRSTRSCARRPSRTPTRSPTRPSRTSTTKNKARFATPATRDLRVVLTKTEAQAPTRPSRRSRTARAGAPSPSSYSIDQASKDAGRLAARHRQGHAGEVLRRRDLRGREGQARPARSRPSSATTSSRCRRSSPAKQQTLKEATPAIKQQLDAQNKQKADDEFNKALRKKWKAKTNCADAYVMTQCKNAPKPKTTHRRAPAQQRRSRSSRRQPRLTRSPRRAARH